MGSNGPRILLPEPRGTCYTDPMRLYLDNCSLQRPLDNKAEVRVLLESEAVLALLALCDSGRVELLASEALAFEIGRNPNATRREYAIETLSSARTFVEVDADIERRAREFAAAGIGPLDALHLASAEAGGADYLCTCDHRFLRRAKGLENLRTQVVSPLDLVGAIDEW